jgi:oligoribonuclease (3'-5' exoribonuclease)
MEVIMDEGKDTFYLWFDLEYNVPDADPSDLDSAAILQVALAVTRLDLQPITPPTTTGGAWSDFLLDRANPTGLRIPVKPAMGYSASDWLRKEKPTIIEESDRARQDEEATERIIIEYIEALPGGKKNYFLAGNSIHNDWYLSRKFFPKFSHMERLSYRLLDVTALKLEWILHKGEKFEKNAAVVEKSLLENMGRPLVGPHEKHDAFFDIQASMAELAHYRSSLWPT